MTETAVCAECGSSMPSQSRVHRFAIHRTCYWSFSLKFWLREAVESFSALWNRADRWLDRNKSVIFGFVGCFLVYALARVM